MTEQADPSPKPEKKKLSKRITARDRVAAMQAGSFLPARRRSAAQVKPPGAAPNNQVSALVKVLLDQADEATAALQENPPPPLSVPRAPLELAVMHASNMMRAQKREPAHACLIAAGAFGLDPEVVLQAWEQTQKRRAPKEEIRDDAGDDFDDEGWDEDA